MRKISVISALVACAVFTAPQVFAQSYYPFSSYSSPLTGYPYSNSYWNAPIPAMNYPSSPYPQSVDGSATSVCANITRDLSYGSRGSQVTQLQAFLVNQRYPGSGDWMMTGYFGGATMAALRNFQQTQGLPQTGVADVATRGTIYLVSCGLSAGHVSGAYAPNYYHAQYPYSQTPAYPPANYNYNTYQYGYIYPYQYTNYYYPSATVLPMISSLYPLSAAIGNTVTVSGAGFSTTGNAVHFGPGVIANINSADGKSLYFAVPSQLVGYGSQPTVLGTYNVSVTNASGYTTNVLPFTVQ